MAAANTSLPDPHYISPGYIDTLIPPGCIPVCTEDKHNQKRVCIGESKKRRRCESTSTYSDDQNQALCWDAFQPYLEKCIPTKINSASSFRHVTNEQASKEPVFSTMSVDSLPSKVLDKIITVQCVPNVNHKSLHPAELSDDKIRQKARDIDEKLSMLSNTSSGNDGEENIPTFMGQEDQVTTCMTFRELVTIDEHTHHVSASQLPILDVDEMEQESISLNVDGKLNHQPANLELSPLASLIRLPSYLLLGNPRNESKDVVIQNINLWHAPQSCCTNVHYDDHDNLLIVTNGVKIVELCPPGCIQASGVYSTHANHPKLLRRGNMQPEEDIQRDIQSTLKRKQGSTHIVTVAAGEALYIPLGWWHRVVSKCDQHDASRRGHGCTAINVWFDYHHPSRQSNVPDHMSVFHLRQCSRRYFELNKDYATALLLEDKKQTYFLENEEILPKDMKITTEENLIHRRDWIGINRIVFKYELLDDESINTFGLLYRRCLTPTQHSTSEHDNKLYCLLEAFLLRIQLGNTTHVAGLVNMMWSEVSVAIWFAEILCKLSPEACYILTQAWERHAGVKTIVDDNGETQDEAELSYRRFFFNLETYSNEVRNHLLNGVEEFYHQAWVKLSSVV
eukprot:scaffold24369_cov216-Skeletonema_marinoi.AAC.22